MIYVASPYSDPDFLVRQARYNQVSHYCAVLTRKKEHCFSPIALWHPIALRHKLGTDAAFWQSYNHEMMLLCSEMHVLKLPGWEASLGVTEEIEYWQKIHIEPMLFVDYSIKDQVLYKD